MHKTTFAGLTELDPGDPITIDGSSFTAENPSRIDYYLRIGAVTHRHDGHTPLASPVAIPSASTTATGGQIAANQQMFVAYTLIDADGGETTRSVAVGITTAAGANAPSGSIIAAFDQTGGTLPVGQFAYAVTMNDGLGGESTLGPAGFVTRPPGFASGRVNLSGLAAELGSQYVSWNLWRSQDGSDFQLLIAGGISDTFTDSGLNCADATRVPPIDQTGVLATNELFVTLPTAVQEPAIASAVGFSLYISLDGTFSDPCLYDADFPIASAGTTIAIPTLTIAAGSPPAVSRASQGADKIDPDTELLDWHWKRPVPTTADLPPTGNASGDVRVTITPLAFNIWNGSVWIVDAGGGADLTLLDKIGDTFVAIDEIRFVGASGVTVSIASGVGGLATVTVAGPSGSIGPAGPAGASGAPGPTGATGAAGASGAPGATGPAGASGAPGATGPPGPTGPTGASGAPGATGATGATGPTGSTGAAGTAVTAVEDGSTRVTPVKDIKFVGGTVADLGGGSAQVTITGGGGGGTTLGVDDGIHLVTPVADIRFTASGEASVGASNLGGGSALVSIGVPDANFTVDDSFGGSARAGGGKAPKPVMFIASGGGSANVTQSGGSAVVTITFVPNSGPAGPQGATGATGAAGASGAPGAAGATGPTGPTGPAGAGGGGGAGGIYIGSAYSASGAGAGPFTPVETTLVFVPSADMVVSAGNAGGGSAVVTFTHAPKGVISLTLGSGLVTNASASVDIPLGRTFCIFEITADDAVRLRLYTTPTKRDADLARGLGVDPPINSGCLLDLIMNSSNLDYHLSPPITGADLRAPAAGVTAANITNMGATGVRTLTFKRLLLEP